MIDLVSTLRIWLASVWGGAASKYSNCNANWFRSIKKQAPTLTPSKKYSGANSAVQQSPVTSQTQSSFNLLCCTHRSNCKLFEQDSAVLGSNLLAMGSNLIAMASNLLAMASNLRAMASDPIAMASTY